MKSHQEIEIPVDTIPAYQKARPAKREERAETFAMHLSKIFNLTRVKLL
jgi:hypothetical protein